MSTLDDLGLGMDLDLGIPGLKKKPRPEWRRPLGDTAQQGVMSSVANGGLSGLSYISSVLDKPGRAVRGILSGKPREALAALPFSDSMGITDPSQATTGRDILHSLGVADKRDKGWGAWGAGVATEMALDPLTYLTLGTGSALTSSGKAAAKSGTLRRLGNADRIAQGHSGLLGLGLPFKDPSVVFGTGNRSHAIAQGLDTAYDAARFKNPIGRQLGAWFDPEVLGDTKEIGQRALKFGGAPAYEKATAQARANRVTTNNAMDAMRDFAPDEDIVSAVNRAREGVSTAGVNPALTPQVNVLGHELQRMHVGQHDYESSLGVGGDALTDKYAQYGTRKALNVPQSTGQQARRSDSLFPTRTADDMKRDELFRNVPGGADVIDTLHRNYAGRIDPMIEHDVMSTLVREAHSAGHGLDPMSLFELHGKAGELTKWLGKRELPRVPGPNGPVPSGPLPFYSPNIPDIIEQKGMNHATKARTGEAVHYALQKMMQPGAAVKGQSVDILRALRDLGLRTRMPDKKLGTDASGALVEALERAGISTGGMSAKDLRATGRSYVVPADKLKDLTSSYQKWVTPSDSSGALKQWDSLSNLFKGMSYSVWLPSHIRNLASAAATNLQQGVGFGANKVAMRVMRDTATAAEIAKYHTGILPGMSDEAARELVRGQAYKHAKIFGGHGIDSDIAGSGENLVQNLLQGNDIFSHTPGADRTGGTANLATDILQLGKEAVLGKKDAAGKQLTSPTDILGQSGVYSRKTGDLRTHDTWSPMAAGRTAGTNIEDFSRLANYLGNTGKGFSPQEAGRLVNKYHFDYGNLTDFEKNVMKRIIPFYTFQSRNLPLQIGTLATRPGNVTTQLRTLGQMNRSEYTPEYLASGVAIPQGENPDGTQRFISQLGLPIEEAFDRMKFSGGMPDIAKTAMAYGSGLNPLIKGPLEQLFNKQFYSGRNLSDLRPTTAGSLGGALGDENAGILTQMISNSPATRFATSFDKLTDNRKGVMQKALNLLTGVRVTDVDVNKSKAIEQRNALEALLARKPHLSQYSSFYVKPDDVASLTPEEIELMRAYSGAQDQAREHAKAQKNKR